MFIVRIVKYMDEFGSFKVFVVRIVGCLNELIGVRCLL